MCSKEKRFPSNTIYKFDCFPSRSARWQWVHKEEREFHGDSDVRSYSIPTVAICADDYAEISVTLMSLMGVMDLTQVQWRPIVFEVIPEQEDIRNYNRLKSLTPDRNKYQKYFADLGRVCEIEDSVIEWYNYEVLDEICSRSLTDHLKRQVDDFMVSLTEQFRISLVEVGGTDFSVFKIYMQALTYPNTADETVFYPDLNMSFRVIPKNQRPKPTKEEMLGRNESDISFEEFDPIAKSMVPKTFMQ